MSNKPCVIVVPIHKNTPSKNDILSLKKCVTIFGMQPIIFIAPYSLSVNPYLDLAKAIAPNIEPQVICLQDRYFLSTGTYNEMMLSVEFYEKFLEYEYMLLYQLDCFVFSDQLKAWCDKDYDYIGAPWFEGFSVSDENSKMLKHAGNGGFSLRKISSFIRVLSLFKKADNGSPVMKFSNIIDLNDKYSFLGKIIRLPKFLIKRWSKDNSYASLRESYMRNGNEDWFFSFYAPIIDQSFKVASARESIPFAFECQPRRLYEMNNKQLPFGCHAFEKNDLEFWEQFIK